MLNHFNVSNIDAQLKSNLNLFPLIQTYILPVKFKSHDFLTCIAFENPTLDAVIKTVAPTTAILFNFLFI